MREKLEELRAAVSRARHEIGKVIIGQEEAVTQSLLVILANRHALVEGVPGIAKTLLVRTLARILGCEFGRVQFTPDLMPSDITGTHVFNIKDNEFSLVKGPLFTTFLLADEINRAPAKTQAALLQAMQEREVSIDRVTLQLPDNFTVFATQNPIEHQGTYPLPEAQKDRFMLKITMDCPARDDEMTLASRMLEDRSPENVLASGDVAAVLAPDTLTALRGGLGAVTVREDIAGYIVDIVRKTREHDGILAGAGPRATQSLILAGRALAVLEGRDYVSPDDIKALAFPVLRHRLLLRPEYEIEGYEVGELVHEILAEVTVPR